MENGVNDSASDNLADSGVNDAAFDNPTDGGVNDSASDNPTDSGVNDSGPDVMGNGVSDSASDNSFVSITDLVSAMNECRSPEKLELLIKWAHNWMEYFSADKLNSSTKEELGDYFAFAGVKADVDHPSKDNFLLTWFKKIAKYVTTGQIEQEPMLEVFERALYRIDHRVFGGNPASLIPLIRYWIHERLYENDTCWTEGTHATHRIILRCARSAMIVAGKVEPKSWDPVDDNSPYRMLQKDLEKLKQRVIFYPTVFEIQLVAATMKQLVISGFQTDWKLFLRKTQAGTAALLCAVSVVKNAITLSIDPVNLRTCADYLSEAVRPVSQKPEDWFIRYQSLNEAYVQVLEDPSNYAVFLEEIKTSTQKERRWYGIFGSRSRGEKALACGIVDLLSQLAVYSVDDQVRDSSVAELRRMQEDWLKDKDILHQTRQSFRVIAEQVRNESSKKALPWPKQCHRLHASIDPPDVVGSQGVDKTVERWRDRFAKNSFVKWMDTSNWQRTRNRSLRQ